MADGPKFVVAALPVRTSVDMRAEYAALCSRIIPRFHPGSFDDQAAIKAELLKAGLLSVEGFAAWDAREWPDKIAVVKILLERRETGEKPADEPRSDEPACIVSRGGGVYSDGRGAPVVVDTSEDDLLRKFIDRPAMSLAEIKVINPRGRDVLGRLRSKYGGIFAPAIIMPGGKGKGGYRVRVVEVSAHNLGY